MRIRYRILKVIESLNEGSISDRIGFLITKTVVPVHANTIRTIATWKRLFSPQRSLSFTIQPLRSSTIDTFKTICYLKSANLDHWSLFGNGALIYASSFLTGWMNESIFECRQILPSLLAEGYPYFTSPTIGQPIEAS